MDLFNTRFASLEMRNPVQSDTFRGTLSVGPGQRPLDALLGAAPGIWLLTTPAVDGGFIGRVTSSGRREIIFSDRNRV